MTNDIENLLQNFHPTDPPAHLREKILAPHPIPAPTPTLHWPTLLYRSSLAASLLLSLSLLHAANQLNQNSASNIGIGPPRWTPQAQAAANLLSPNGTKEEAAAARQYIALCLLADHARPSSPPTYGDLP